VTRYLVDTNVISELRKGARCDQAVQQWQGAVPLQAQFISVIVLFELYLGIALKRQRDECAGLTLANWYERRVKPGYAGRTLEVNMRICERAALLHVPNPRPFRDSLIAATALEHGLVIATRNTVDFEHMGAELLNPWQPGGGL